MEALAGAFTQIAGLVFLAFFIWSNVEGSIEYFVKPALYWSEATKEERRGYILRWIALFLGIVTAFLLGLDLLTMLVLAAGATPVSPAVGIVMTGIFMARGSNWLHDRFTNPFRDIIEVEEQVVDLSSVELEHPPDAPTHPG